MKKLKKIIALGASLILASGAVGMFAGCSTDNPEVTITYTFRDKDYAVEYVLSRKSAPATVQHFIELADHGFYNGLCIHDYDSAHLYGGAYTYDGTELEEVDYFTKASEYNLTQTVYDNISDNKVGLNTLYGEFGDNGVKVSGTAYAHAKGALVMYYTDKGKDTTRVATVRSGNGELQENSLYKYNSATSMFYTYSGSTISQTAYAVFGKAKYYSTQLEGDNGLLTAIKNFITDMREEESEEAYSFTEDKTVTLNQYDPVDSVRNAKIKATFRVPTEPIVIKSVRVTQY